MSDLPTPLDQSLNSIRQSIGDLSGRISYLQKEQALLSGRVDLTLRLLARIVGKMDPAFTESPHDPDVLIITATNSTSLRTPPDTSSIEASPSQSVVPSPR